MNIEVIFLLYHYILKSLVTAWFFLRFCGITITKRGEWFGKRKSKKQR